MWASIIIIYQIIYFMHDMIFMYLIIIANIMHWSQAVYSNLAHIISDFTCDT